jgi:hypothetical protein
MIQTFPFCTGENAWSVRNRAPGSAVGMDAVGLTLVQSAPALAGQKPHLHAHGVVPGVDVERRAGHVLRVIGEQVRGGRPAVVQRRDKVPSQHRKTALWPLSTRPTWTSASSRRILPR